jgi:hypothetical protein
MALSTFHKAIGKKLWFVIFNVVCIAYLAISGRLEWTAESVVSCIFVMLLMNGIALISARKFSDWR